MFRSQFQRFLADYVVPFHADWEKAGSVPREVWLQAGKLGFLCPTMPEEYRRRGRVTSDTPRSSWKKSPALNTTGLGFAMHNDVVAHYLLDYGSDAIKAQWLPKMARGEAIAALGLTEPGSGSDLKAIQIAHFATVMVTSSMARKHSSPTDLTAIS